MPEALAKAIPALVAAHTVSVAYVDLQTGARYEYKADQRFHAASTMKLPVLMAAQAHDLDQRVRVANRFQSIADGSWYETDARDDSDDWVYQQIGKDVAFRKLVERMIVRSSNLATNVVLQHVPPAEVQKLCDTLGAGDMHVLRGVEDDKAHEKGLDNTTTAHALAVLLEKAATMPPVVDVLAAQQLNEGIPAALPPGTRVAHKTGSITAHYHDAAIIFPNGRKPYILVVLTKGFADEKDAVALVKDISRIVWLDATRQRD